MFRPSNPQFSLLEVQNWIPEATRKRLETGWAHVFRREVLDMIPESAFASLFHATHGRPNTPVTILVSLSILKEMLDLTDEALMESFYFDLRFHHALRLPLDEASMAIRTLYYFRQRVVGTPAVMATFTEVTKRIAEALSLSLGDQRLDSTHICSNMATLTRLGLFTKTIETFLKRLQKAFPSQFKALPKVFRERYTERSGYFADVRGSQSQRRLEVVAKDLWTLVDRFRSDVNVRKMHGYKLLKRLLDEQCLTGDNDDNELVGLKPPKEIASDTLQNPSDPDATYDGHKGQGYQAQLSETCAKDNPIQVITHVDVEQAHKSDQNATIPTIDALAERGHAPKKLFADTSYNSGKNLIEAGEREVDLIAPTPGKADPDAIVLGHFDLNLEEMRVRACPMGLCPLRDSIGKDGKTRNLQFDQGRCAACGLVLDCPAGKKNGRLRIHPNDIATAFSRAREETDAFKEDYKIRSGIESTNAECKTAHGLGKLWSRGLPRVTFAVLMKALACNVKRFMRHQCAQISGNRGEMAMEAA